ncbi:DUF262 domain-containing protein [Kribbella sp. NPDC002412]
MTEPVTESEILFIGIGLEGDPGVAATAFRPDFAVLEGRLLLDIQYGDRNLTESRNFVATRRTTTKDIGLLFQLYEEGQLKLTTEYQRNSVWPRAAKVYLIDSILRERPIPPLLVQRHSAAGGGRVGYEVIDGQQRLRTVFEFLSNRFRLNSTAGEDRAAKRFKDLSRGDQDRILDYDFVVEELSGYRAEDIQDIFVRFNRFVVTLNQAEIRNARERGAFATFVEKVGGWDYWVENRIITPQQVKRYRAVEFAAELIILLAEGPQDKKSSIDIWYQQYRDDFPEGEELEKRLRSYQQWIANAVPNLSRTQYRRPVDYYALIGALDLVTAAGTALEELDATQAGVRLSAFEDDRSSEEPSSIAVRYLTAASRQTDNLRPRETRIEILSHLLAGGTVSGLE